MEEENNKEMEKSEEEKEKGGKSFFTYRASNVQTPFALSVDVID